MIDESIGDLVHQLQGLIEAHPEKSLLYRVSIPFTHHNYDSFSIGNISQVDNNWYASGWFESTVTNLVDTQNYQKKLTPQQQDDYVVALKEVLRNNRVFLLHNK